MSETKQDMAVVPAQAQQVARAQRAVAFGDQGAEIKDSTDLWALAKIMANGLAKADKPVTDREIYGVAVMIQAGKEVGLTPVMSTRALFPVNGRPAWMLEGLVGVMRHRGIIPNDDEDAWDYTYENLPPDGTQIKDWPNDAACVVKLRRCGWKSAKAMRFSVGDAKLAGLWGKSGPWSNYPKRQLYARAGGFICRDYAGDVTLGLPIVEEARDIAELRDVTPAAHAPQQSGLGLLAMLDAEPEPMRVEAEVVAPAETGPAPEPPSFDPERAMADLVADVEERVGEDGDDETRAQLLASAVAGMEMTVQEDFYEAHKRLRQHAFFGDAASRAPKANDAPAGLFGDPPAPDASRKPGPRRR